MLRKVAIFGGTFDPVHWGHLRIAERAVSQFNLDQVFWVPTDRPPHKRQVLTEFEHRLAMVRQAIADNSTFTVADVDAPRSGLSYAIETFQDLKARHADCQWHWIIGEDAFQTLSKWRGSETLTAGCTWLVAPRSDTCGGRSSVNSTIRLYPSEQFRSHWLEMPALEISSSLIRHYCQQGRSIRYLVPEAVRQYIQQHQLFQALPK